jgi:hypothetical protein
MGAILVANNCDYANLAIGEQPSLVVSLAEFGVKSFDDPLGNARWMTDPDWRGYQQYICAKYLRSDLGPIIALTHVSFDAG